MATPPSHRTAADAASSQAVLGRQQRVLLLAVLAVALGALAWGDPYAAAWPLGCPLRRLTGWLCPLCGTQRALHEALHGHLAESWRLSPALWILSPWWALLLAGALSARIAAWRAARWARSGRVVLSVVGLLVLWGIVRNLLGV